MIYLVQSGLIIYLVKDKFDLEKQIGYQRARITELEEKLKILQVIDDFQIGFTDEERNELADVISSECKKYDYDPMFLMALIITESSFIRGQTSSKGARGLMQIIPSTGDEIAAKISWPENYKSTDLYRPIVSLRFGMDYLNQQKELFNGDLYAALAAYNGGPGNAKIWYELGQNDPDLFLETIRYEETRQYIRRIFENFSIYRFIYNRTS